MVLDVQAVMAAHPVATERREVIAHHGVEMATLLAGARLEQSQMEQGLAGQDLTEQNLSEIDQRVTGHLETAIASRHVRLMIARRADSSVTARAVHHAVKAGLSVINRRLADALAADLKAADLKAGVRAATVRSLLTKAVRVVDQVVADLRVDAQKAAAQVASNRVVSNQVASNQVVPRSPVNPFETAKQCVWWRDV